MNYDLGFDGGGTKTDAAVIDAAGRLVGEGTAGPSNPLRVGYDAAFAAMRAAAEKALAAAHVEQSAVRAVCAALAGAGRPGVAQRVTEFLRATFPGAFAHVASDFEAALEAAAGAAPGVVLIAGTGSVAFGRNAAGETARAGGYGPWIGDAGSAFDIGRRTAMELARIRDRADERASDEYLRRLGIASWDDLIERVAEHADQVFPQIFPIVAEKAEAKDPVARNLLEAAARDLGELAAAVIDRLNMKDEPFVLAKAGGVFGHSRALEERLDSMLAKLAPQARIERLTTAPAVGAARLAQRMSERARS